MITLGSSSPKEPIPPLVKIMEVAKLLSISRQTVHALVECGDLEGEKITPKGTKRVHVRITRESLLVFYKKRFGHPLDRALENPFTTSKS